MIAELFFVSFTHAPRSRQTGLAWIMWYRASPACVIGPKISIPIGLSTTFVVGLVMMCVGILAAVGTGLIIFKKLRDKRSAAERSSGDEK